MQKDVTNGAPTIVAQSSLALQSSCAIVGARHPTACVAHESGGSVALGFADFGLQVAVTGGTPMLTVAALLMPMQSSVLHVPDANVFGPEVHDPEHPVLENGVAVAFPQPIALPTHSHAAHCAGATAASPAFAATSATGASPGHTGAVAAPA